MAAAALLREPLPPPWNYGVTEDGRVFFINEEHGTTTWLHPIYQHPVQAGHNSHPELPRGWEKDVTAEGAPYYIDHVGEITTFNHPVTGESAAVELRPDPTYQQYNQRQDQQDQQHAQHKQPQQRRNHERQKSDQDLDPDSASKKKGNKVLDRPPSATRKEDSPVSMRGWLYKQDSGGLKSWKKKWFVLSDFCLFYYKGPEEGKSLGSVLLPSYRINPCAREDGVSRKFAFKAEHDNMRTYFFAAESQDEMRQWMNAMSLASIMQHDPRYRQHLEQQGYSVEMELNRKQPNQDASRDESFQSSHSSERQQPPASRWTGEQNYTDGGSYYTDSRYQEHASPEDQASLQSYPRDQHYDPYGRYPEDRNPSASPNGHQRGYLDQESYGKRSPNDRAYPDEGPYGERGPNDRAHPNEGPYGDRGPNGFGSYPDQGHYNEDRDPSGHPQYQDQAPYGEKDDPMFYQPGQLQKQKPLTDLSRFDSNTEIPGYEQNRFNQDAPDHGGYPGSVSRSDREPVYSQPRKMASPVRSPSMERVPPPHHGHGGSSNRLAPQQYPQHQTSYDSASGRDRNSVTSRDRNSMTGSYRQIPGPQSTRPGSGAYPGHSPVFNHLEQWRDRVQNSPRPSHGSQQDLPYGNYQKQYQNNNNNPIYENLNTSPMGYRSSDPADGQTPGRPPLPTTYRDQIVQELAGTKTPGTQEDMLTSTERMQRRHEMEPLVFQYPDVRDTREDGWRGSQQQVLPESYLKARHDAEEAERARQWDQSPSGGQTQNYPDAYWKAKNNLANKPDAYQGPDPKRHSSASQRSEPTYSTIPVPESQHTQHQQMAPPPNQQTPRSSAMPRAATTTQQYPDSQNATYNTTNNSFDITTIKEDPTMEDQDVLVTKKLEKLKDNLNGHRLRLSISAGDLVGKSHEELVLLLIQLRRSQARLADEQGWYRQQMDVGRDVEKEYKRRRNSEYMEVPEPLEEEHQHFETLRQGQGQVQKQVDISKPLVNLVDNLVTMGSIYGGNNLMLASQYKQQRLPPGQYLPPKKMIEFSRQHQEAKLTQEQEEQLKQLQEDEADLEEKLQQLYQLDRELQEHSFAVTSLQEDWELLQKALEGIKKQELQESDSRALSRLAQQRRTIEHELSKVRQQLADASKRLEETAADNARVENEVLLLRKKIMKGLDNGGLDKPVVSESLRTKEQLEAELTSVQTMIDGLTKQGAKLGEVMTSLRKSQPDLTEVGQEETFKKQPEKKQSGPTYAETDLDSMETRDLGNNRPLTIFKDKSPSSGSNRPTSHVVPQTKTHPVNERISPPNRAAMGSSHSVNSSYGQPAGHSVSPSYGQPSGYGQPSQTQAYNSKPPQSYPQQQYSPQTSYALRSQLPQDSGLYNGHARQTSLPTAMSSPTSPERAHSSMTDLRHHQQNGRATDSYPHQTSYAHPQRPSSATFGHEPTRTSRPGAPPFGSEPNLSGRVRSADNISGAPVQRSVQQTVAYSQPASIAYSEPYGQDRTASVVYSPTEDYRHPREVPDYVNIGPSGEVYDTTEPTTTSVDQYLQPLDINEADDNMKRFYGILPPREKPRATTVRDVKKRENERRGRERGRRSLAEDEDEDWEDIPASYQQPRDWKSQSLPKISTSGFGAEGDKSPSPLAPAPLESTLQRTGSTSSVRSNSSRSAAERLFPAGSSSTRTEQYDPTSVERVRRMSDIFTPRPFSASTTSGNRPTGYRPVSMFNLSTNTSASSGVGGGSSHNDRKPSPSPAPQMPPPTLPLAPSSTIATVRPVLTSSSKSFLGERASNTATVKPMSKSMEDVAGRGGGRRGRRGKEKDRFLTVSSSQPVSMESPAAGAAAAARNRARMRSAAGDLITSTVKSDDTDDFKFDDLTIDREVLFVPDKVEIPERYVPDSDDEVTEEEAMIRQEKSEKYRKLLAAQSLQEWRENELSESNSHYLPAHVTDDLREEKRRREALLDIRQALAREVSQKTRQVAEMHRKATSEMELRHVGETSGGPSTATSFMSLYETPTYQRRSVLS